MPMTYESSNRLSSLGTMSSSRLEDKFEVVKDIGDGSFGSVSLARVRTAGAHIAKRGTMIAIKTMKKTFDSFAPCLELREVIFLRTLPPHVHLVPALDIFLDPTTRKLHICMEYMDGNLYQLMKARDHRCLDGGSVKSILLQILSGLDHIHTNNFFHRDIKPENILVSTSALQESSISFRRYSALVTPPPTPPCYTVKIADFGLARETESKMPFTTYVSTRWYRAPEVLLRAGEYSAPVDMWAFGAMAVEVATLKPLFPGGNEVDQVWRVCEIMGSPGNWYSKAGTKVGGGDWKDGTRLAQKLGFSFPKMAPHSMDSILQSPQWPASFSSFVTWCLMWDPKSRPTSLQAMNHEFFSDAVDPVVRPKSNRLLGRKHSKESDGLLSTRPSWFRKSLIGRDSAPAVPQLVSNAQGRSPRQSPVHSNGDATPSKSRPHVSKRATWSNGPTPSVGAPMPILPSIRPVSPLSNAVTAQARSTNASENGTAAERTEDAAPGKVKKIGRQLSLASHGNHYGDVSRQDPELVLSGVVSAINGQKEGFFSHLRKRARRLSGRNQIPNSPKYDDLEATAGCTHWTSNRSSMMVDSSSPAGDGTKSNFSELDKALQNVRRSLDASSHSNQPHIVQTQKQPVAGQAAMPASIRKHPSATHTPTHRPAEEAITPVTGPISSRTRRALHLSTHPAHRYETPDEEEELLDEALDGVRNAMRGLGQPKKLEGDGSRSALASKDVNRLPLSHALSIGAMKNPYPTPTPSAKRSGQLFANGLLAEPATPLSMCSSRTKGTTASMWPTPPYDDDNEWAAAATASVFAVAHR